MKALIIGGSGGLGGALVAALCERQQISEVIATYHHTAPVLQHRKLTWQRLDLRQEAQIVALAADLDRLDMLINAAGMLHQVQHLPEKSIARLEPEFFMDNMAINALPTLLLAKHARGALAKAAKPVFATISARVGSIEENQLGGWYSYRCSKAALNMALKTLSIEWMRTLPQATVAALHPGTNATALSAPFQKGVPEDKLFNPQRGAQQLLAIIDRLSPAQTGRFWSWDGSELPW
jgi:NAD(P)-dependent dehydrogenase (short-subunit alcohol dehydrogenase family)